MSSERNNRVRVFQLYATAFLFLSAVSMANPLFNEPSYVFDLNVPYLCETADFNCDGNEDFIVIGYEPHSINVFLGSGDGTFCCFQQISSFVIGSISVCQLNSDAYPDLIVSNEYDETIQVYLGDGLGGFQLGEVLTHDHFSVNTGDLNGDGYSDLLIPYNISSHYWIDVFLCDGEGSFVADSSYEVGHYGIAHFASVTGDLNGDGFADVAYVPSAMWRLGIMLGNGDGTLQSEYFCGSSYENCGDWSTIAEGDFNEDGHIDLAATSGTGWAKDMVLVNDGSGGFSTSDSLGKIFMWVVAEDFDLDGHLDLAGSSMSSIEILKGWGDGTFGGSIYSNYPSIGQLGVADFDNDGDQDIVRLNDSVYVYLNKTIQLGLEEPEELTPAPVLNASPNPFSNSLSLFVQNCSGNEIVQVFDLSGRGIIQLPVDQAGNAFWNGVDCDGVSVPSGVYLIRAYNEEATLFSAILKL